MEFSFIFFTFFMIFKLKKQELSHNYHSQISRYCFSYLAAHSYVGAFYYDWYFVNNGADYSRKLFIFFEFLLDFLNS
jgi:hypothetical protein